MTIAPRDLLLLNFLVEDKKPGAAPLDALLGRALRALRSYLSLDIAYISQSTPAGGVICHLDAAPDCPRFFVGGRDPYDHSTCGALGMNPHTHICVPIQLDDGVPYGTLTCIGSREDLVLTPRDLSMVRVFAELAAEHIEADVHAAARLRESTERIQEMIAGQGTSLLYQPIYDVSGACIAGFEAFARFAGPPPRGPDLWFADASRVGLETELGAKLIAQSMESFERFPQHVYIGFNVSPHLILHGQLDRAFTRAPLERIVLEINSHLSIRQYDEMAKMLRPLRDQGLRISVDDAGGGLDSFRHILQLQPDIIKLHMSLVRNIDSDAACNALAAALIQFGREQHCDIVAEGVETAGELSVLKRMGVTKMQGYLLGRPMELEVAMQLCEREGARRALSSSAQRLPGAARSSAS